MFLFAQQIDRFVWSFHSILSSLSSNQTYAKQKQLWVTVCSSMENSLPSFRQLLEAEAKILQSAFLVRWSRKCQTTLENGIRAFSQNSDFDVCIFVYGMIYKQ